MNHPFFRSIGCVEINMGTNWTNIVTNLRAILGDERVTDDPLDLLCYSKDAAIESGTPNVVVFPETTKEVIEIVKKKD